MQNRKRDTDVQNSLLESVGEGEGGMFQENSIETYIIQGETDHQPTPVFMPGEFYGQRSLVGYNPCGHKELDTTEPLQWLRLQAPGAEGPGSFPGQGTRSHMPQLRVCML